MLEHHRSKKNNKKNGRPSYCRKGTTSAEKSSRNFNISAGDPRNELQDAPDDVLAFEPTGLSSETSGITSTIVCEHAI